MCVCVGARRRIACQVTLSIDESNVEILFKVRFSCDDNQTGQYRITVHDRRN